MVAVAIKIAFGAALGAAATRIALRALFASRPSARRLVDLSITLENEMVTDPPFMRPRITYQTHDETVGELGHFFPGVTREQTPMARASPPPNG